MAKQIVYGEEARKATDLYYFLYVSFPNKFHPSNE